MSGEIWKAPGLLIQEYQVAYRAANKKPPPPVTYLNGWYRISYPGGSRAFRKLSIIEMTYTLNRRAGE